MITPENLDIVRNACDEILLHMRDISCASLEDHSSELLAKVEYELYNIQAIGIFARRVADRIHKNLQERRVTI